MGAPGLDDAVAIAVEQLTVDHGPVRAVDGVDLTVRTGEVVGLLGPNGAGKTTTVETLEGFRRPTRGSVRVFGLDPYGGPVEVMARVGVMLQDGGVATGMRVAEAVALTAAYYAAPLDTDELIDQVGLEARRRATWRTLSGGERQRLSLALALVGRPDVLVLDEPTAGVDPAGRQLIRSIIAAQRDAGTAVLLTTHDLEDAEQLADRVAIIDRGRVVAEGTPADLTAGGTEDIEFRADPGLDLAALGAAIGATITETAPGSYLVAAPPEPTTIAALTAWMATHDRTLGDLRGTRRRLEDVFLMLTAETATASTPATASPDHRRRGRRRPR